MGNAIELNDMHDHAMLESSNKIEEVSSKE